MINFFAARYDAAARTRFAGAVVATAIAAALFSRFNIHGGLTRDEGVYVYAGRQLAHGVPPYASVFDPKGPLPVFLTGLGAGIARLLGRDDVMVMRGLFFIVALLTVLVLYLLVTRLWDSMLAGVVAAVVFASFEGYAQAALVGPDAKVPGVLCAVLAMWLVARRQWLLAGGASALAVLDWQPFIPFLIAVLVAAAIASPADRRRRVLVSTAGVAVPFAAMFGYFAAAGAFGRLIEGAVVFPLTGIQREHESFGGRFAVIGQVVWNHYGMSGVLFWIGLLLLITVVVVTVRRRRAEATAVATDPLLVVIAPTFVFEAAYAVYDFQGYPDVYPLLPYAAIGFGAATALAVRRVHDPQTFRTAVVALGTALAVLTAASWVLFDRSPANDDDLVLQRAFGCALNYLVLPGTSLYSLGNPVVDVVTHRRNPDRFIYLDSGVDAWKVDRTPGGLRGWGQQILARHPSVIVLDKWTEGYSAQMQAYLLNRGLIPRYIGPWLVLMTPEARRAMRRDGVVLRLRPHRLSADLVDDAPVAGGAWCRGSAVLPLRTAAIP